MKCGESRKREHGEHGPTPGTRGKFLKAGLVRLGTRTFMVTIYPVIVPVQTHGEQEMTGSFQVVFFPDDQIKRLQSKVFQSLQ